MGYEVNKRDRNTTTHKALLRLQIRETYFVWIDICKRIIRLFESKTHAQTVILRVAQIIFVCRMFIC